MKSFNMAPNTSATSKSPSILVAFAKANSSSGAQYCSNTSTCVDSLPDVQRTQRIKFLHRSTTSIETPGARFDIPDRLCSLTANRPYMACASDASSTVKKSNTHILSKHA